MKIKIILTFAFFSLLTACSSYKTGEAWPEEFPPMEHFISAFQADETAQLYQTQDEYLYWVVRFYNGVNIVPGWLGLSEQVLEKLEEPYRSEVELRLFSLGSRIGSEWPKDNAVRKLNTRSANVWRESLLEALDRNELDSYLDLLDDDVNALLAGSLDNEEIYFERYYEDEFDF